MPRWSPRILGLLLLTIGARSGLCGASESPGAMGLKIESRSVIDTTPLTPNGKPTHLYDFGVTPKGRIVALKYSYPLASPREEADAVSMMIEGVEDSWQRVLLTGQRFSVLGSSPQIVVGGEGQIIVGWIGGMDLKESDLRRAKVMAKEFTETQGWGNSFNVADEDAYWVSSFAMMVPRKNNDVIEALWTDSRDRHFDGLSHIGFDYYSKPFARTWRKGSPSAVERVDRKKRKYVAYDIKGALAPDSNMYALWEKSEGGTGRRLQLSVRSDGKWAQPMQVSDGDTDHLQYAVASSGAGEAIILWVGDETQEELHSRRYSRGRLGPFEKIADHASCPMMVTDSGGNIHLIYQDAYPWSRPDHRRDPVGRLFYQRRDSQGWSRPQEIASNVLMLSARIGVDAEGRCHIMWQQQTERATEAVHVTGRPTIMGVAAYDPAR
jgi:hypothetical protein